MNEAKDEEEEPCLVHVPDARFPRCRRAASNGEWRRQEAVGDRRPNAAASSDDGEALSSRAENGDWRLQTADWRIEPQTEILPPRYLRSLGLLATADCRHPLARSPVCRRKSLSSHPSKDWAQTADWRQGMENGENENREKKCRATFMAISDQVRLLSLTTSGHAKMSNGVNTGVNIFSK